nr:zinc-binding dehydrogenase [Levilactobacillus lindianensis]
MGLQTLIIYVCRITIRRQTKRVGASYRFIFVQSSGAQLAEVSRLVTAQHLAPAIDPTVFKLSEINQALDLVLHGHAKGKVLIRFAD